LDMMIQAGRELLSIIRIARRHRVAADDATIDLVQPDHASKFGRLAGLTFADDRGVRLEQADQLLARPQLLVQEHAASSLVNNLLHQRDVVLQRPEQLLRSLTELLVQGSDNLLSLL